MREIVYSQTKIALSEGQVQRNPRFYTGPEDDVSAVSIYGDWPKINGDYRVRDVEVRQLTPVTRPDSEDIALTDAPADWEEPVQEAAGEQGEQDQTQPQHKPRRRRKTKADSGDV